MTGVKLSSINFRRKIHSIKTVQELIDLKDYITQFVKSRNKNDKTAIDSFLNIFQTINDNFDDPGWIPGDIDAIKIWILGYIDKEPESPLYEFICLNYPDINMSFNDFYQDYTDNISCPLNKNHVSRALNALGINPIMKKVKVASDSGRDRKKCVMMIRVAEDTLAEILKKNGFISQLPDDSVDQQT